MGAAFSRSGGFRWHPVLDQDWNVTPVTAGLKDVAQKQLGTSGSGNHFVDLGIIKVRHESHGGSILPSEARGKLAILSHSGSRGPGAKVAAHYTKVAKEMHPDMPQGNISNLAWIDLSTQEGQEYWAAMNLMGDFASANHACIHYAIKNALGLQGIWGAENHHNFAWKETHFGKEVIVHRKGATPAGKSVIGVIPGTMADYTHIVVGKGNPDSLDSASHGAGRRMSRTAARKLFTADNLAAYLSAKDVELLSGDLDEHPEAYKDITGVMEAQLDLVESQGIFVPHMVIMAPPGEKPED
jgi:tRNA-splicing ligase RtcB